MVVQSSLTLCTSVPVAKMVRAGTHTPGDEVSIASRDIKGNTMSRTRLNYKRLAQDVVDSHHGPECNVLADTRIGQALVADIVGLMVTAAKDERGLITTRIRKALKVGS